MAVKNRDEIEEKYRWDLSGIFKDDDAFLAALEEAKAWPARIAAYQGKISQSPEELLGYLRLDDELTVRMGRLFNYVQRKSDEDTRVALWQDYSAQVMTLAVTVSAAASWATPEILTLDEEKTETFYAACPDLALYRRELDLVFRMREHVLSPAEEALLASAGDMAQQPDNIYSMFNDADLTFPDATDSEGESHPVTHGTFIPLMYSRDRALRRSAFESVYGVYGQFRNTAAAVLGAQTKTLKFFSDARKYPDSRAAALDGNEVPETVYDSLIDAVHRNLPALHKYIALRRRLLGVDELHFYDLYVPMVGDAEMTFTFEEACDLMLRALAPLGEDYLALVREALDNRWIDVYENPGKRSGAYSAGTYGTHPYMLMNFQGTLNDVFTLVHEMGHSVHTCLSCRTQPSVYSNYVIFVAEVASTCNEALLMQYLLDHTEDPRQRAYLINYYLEEFRTTLYRQTMFAEFELEVNRMTGRGEGVTADALDECYGRLNADYFGDGIVQDDAIKLEWARIPHFYYDYYVYQYATGFAAAVAIAEKILTGGRDAVDSYLRFLGGGCSLPPIELLKIAGVDLSAPAPIDEALRRFDELTDELDELLRG